MTERQAPETGQGGKVKRRGSVLWILLRKFLGKRAAVYFGCILLMVVCGSVFQIMVSVTIGGLCDMARQGTAEGLRELLAGNLPVIVLAMAGNLTGTIGYNDEAKRVGTKINNEVFAKALRLPGAVCHELSLPLGAFPYDWTDETGGKGCHTGKSENDGKYLKHAAGYGSHENVSGTGRNCAPIRGSQRTA